MPISRNSREFFDVMKKKPALQAILDNLDSYSVEELENIHGQPLWIRKILIEIKQPNTVNEEERTARIEDIADQMMSVTESLDPPEPTKYEVFEFIGCDWLMSCGRTGSLKIEVKPSDCLYIIDCDHTIEKYVIGMDSAVGILTKQQWFMFLHNSVFCGKMTKPEYSAFVSERLGKNFRDRDDVARTAGPNSYVSPEESNKSFTIIRHDVK